MRLSVPKIDGRTILGANLQHEIVDEDTGSVVGCLSAANGSSLSNSRSRYVDLFDGKYRGEFDSHAECAAFAAGVAAVLTHMIEKKTKSVQEASAA